jgi:hypothetical protein
MGIIDPSTIKWYPSVETELPVHSFLDYEKSLVKHNVLFDKIRFCDLENLIHVWKNERSLTKKNNINEFRNLFEKNFKVVSINYDFFKYYIFKIKLQANKVGKCFRLNLRYREEE